MKWKRAGTWAATMLLLPQAVGAEEKVVWHSASNVRMTTSAPSWGPFKRWLHDASAWRHQADATEGSAPLEDVSPQIIDLTPNWKKVSPESSPPATLLAPVPKQEPSKIPETSSAEDAPQVLDLLPDLKIPEMKPETKKAIEDEPKMLPPMPLSEPIFRKSDPTEFDPANPKQLLDGPERIEVMPRVTGEPKTLPMEGPSAALESPYSPNGGPAIILRPSPPPQSVAVNPSTTATTPWRDGFLAAFTPQGLSFSIRADYLQWWVKNDRTPSLATTGSEQGGGVIGAPGTVSLFGPGAVDLSQRSGARLRAAIFFDPEESTGLEGGVFFLGDQSTGITANSNSLPVLSRPVFLVNNNQENVENVAFPNFSTGTLEVDAVSRLWGADANFVMNLTKSQDRTLNAYVGYRYLNLQESIRIQEFITAGPDNPDPIGTQIALRDKFSTTNQFNGGQIGLRMIQNWNRFSLDARAGVALGFNRQTLSVEGRTIRNQPGMPTETFDGGLLALRSNIGRTTRGNFSVVPDFSLNLGYQITPSLRGYVGYSFLYWTNVARPGAQIDRSIDLALVPNAPAGVMSTGQNRPSPLFDQNDFWAHGVNLGIEWSW